LRRAGHTLKSSSRDFGASSLSDLGKLLENLGKEHTTNGAPDLVAQTEAEFESVRTALEQICKGGES